MFKKFTKYLFELIKSFFYKVKVVEEWAMHSAVPTYGLIIFSIFCISVFTKKSFFVSLVSVLVGADFLATSFAFLFATIFMESKANKVIRIRVAINSAICAMLYILMKVHALTVPDNFKEILCHPDAASFVNFSLFSIASVIITFNAIYDVGSNKKYQLD